MKKIHVLTPAICSPNESGMNSFQPFDLASIDEIIRVESVNIVYGPSSIENEVDEALSLPSLLDHAMRLEASGSSGILIDCMADPGLGVLRSALSIPVIGAGQTAFHLAAMLCSKFSVLDVGGGSTHMLERLFDLYGLRNSLASLRSTDLPVEHISADTASSASILTEQALKAVEHDGADGIVFGCTGFRGFDLVVREGLLAKGYSIPVIDPAPLGVRVLGAIVLQNLAHSKASWPSPEKSHKRLELQSDSGAFFNFYL